MKELIDGTNDGDNRRIWHNKVTDTGRGFYLWVGNVMKKLPIWSDAGNLWYEGLDRSEVTDSLANARDYFTITRQNYLTAPGSNEPIHSFDNCGGYWLGIARTPLPKDWHLPTSRWSGWAHIMHSQFDDYHLDDHKIPHPSEIFEYVRHSLKGYPPDLTQYSGQLVDTFNLNEVNSERLIKHFPWLSPQMTKR